MVEPAATCVSNQDLKVVGHISTRFSFVTESLSLIGAGLRDREYPAVRFGDREPHAIL
ncbi:MAG: hypothetical protein ACRDG6_06750 [Candidatus Limnocylindria bacterium]